jgi:hypothetical protein
MRLILLVAAVTLLAGTATADAREASALQHSTHVLTFFSNHSWLVAPNQKKCWDVPWQKSCRIGRELVHKHTDRIDKYERTIPNTDNWTRAMRYAQRPFPGTHGWLSFISDRECRACYTVPGGFVCNYQGSGACGPMQFMSGTFYGHADDARAHLARHGYIVSSEVWAWQNPLGQALTAAYMRYTGQDGCHWCL